MEFFKLTDRIYYLCHEEETDRPVLGYICGDNISVAVDAGNSKQHVRAFYRELRKRGLRLPDYTVITHWHWDHTFGMHACVGKTIASVATNEKLKEFLSWRWSEEDMARRLREGQEIEFCDRRIHKEYPDIKKIKVVKADIELSGQMELDLGGVTCEICEVICPHSEGSVYVYIPQEKVLFSGDAGCEDFYLNDGDEDEEKLMLYISAMKKIDFETEILSHDVLQTKEEMLAHLKAEISKTDKRGRFFKKFP